MKITKIVASSIILILISNSSYSQFLGIGGVKYTFPNATLKPVEVCGRSRCTPGQNNGVILHFTKNLFSPEINDAITEEEVVLSVVGRTVKEDDLFGSTPVPCSEKGVTPFTSNDITKMGVRAYKVKYNRKSTLNINVNAAVEANMKEIMKVENNPTKLKTAEAKIKLAYERINGREVSVNAIYTEWGLKADVLNSIRAKNDKYKGCRDFIFSKPYRLITAIGLVTYDMTYQQNSVSKLANEIQAQVESELGIKASFSFTFKREVTKDILAKVENGYSIPVWEHTKEKIEEY